MTKFIRLIWLPIILAGCMSGTNQTNNSNPSTQALSKTVKTINSTNDSVFTLGGTYDSMSNHPTNTKSCLNIANDPSAITMLSPRASLTFDSMSDSNAVQRALGINYTATYGWGAFSTTTSYHYAQSSQDDNYTLNLNYVYQYASKAVFKSGALSFGNSSLTPEAQNLVASDPVDFRQLCGTGFVAELNAGASVLMRLSLKFNSHSEKNAYDESFHTAVGLSNILSIIKSNPSNIKYTLTLSGIQVGGNNALFNQLFTAHGGIIGSDGYPIVTCTTGGSDCTNLINQVIDYARNIGSQLNTFSDYYLYNPTIEEWSSLDIFPGAVNPDQETLKAMQDLSIQFNSDENTYTFLINYYHMLNSFGMVSQFNEDLAALIIGYEKVLAIYQNSDNKVMDCYNGYVSTQCVSIKNNIFTQRRNILNDSRLNNLRSYLEENRYTANLLVSNDLHGTTANCDLAPISDQSSAKYMVNCNGQVSGSPNNFQVLTIVRDPISDLLTVNNLNYNYIPIGTNTTLSFNYLAHQTLLPDIYSSNVWYGNFTISANNNSLGTAVLNLVNMSN